jgi:phosphoglycolate phosphatase-like HAD superfamily hydrolase
MENHTMSPTLKAVFFDVDGVLIDSLRQHLEFCRDKVKKFGLESKIPVIPDEERFRAMVSRGTRVSPMREFFIAVGFPPDIADRADVDYKNEFMQQYRPAMFAGVEEMLSKLRNSGLRLGLVTSNTREKCGAGSGHSNRSFRNVLPVLSEQQHRTKDKGRPACRGGARFGLGSI